jgi:hypothetical protein
MSQFSTYTQKSGAIKKRVGIILDLHDYNKINKLSTDSKISLQKYILELLGLVIASKQNN